MADIDTVEVPWDKFPPMKVWRVVRKVPPQSVAGSGWIFGYEPAESQYKGYPHRADAVKEAQRLTNETGQEHVTIRAWLVAVEKAEA